MDVYLEVGGSYFFFILYKYKMTGLACKETEEENKKESLGSYKTELMRKRVTKLYVRYLD